MEGTKIHGSPPSFSPQEGYLRLRRYKTTCCSRLSRPQAGTALGPFSAVPFFWAVLVLSIQVLPLSPACSLLTEECPIVPF